MENREIPQEWLPTEIDIKSGWKYNSKILGEIVTAINEEMYVEDENYMMEMMEPVLEWLKENYIIQKRETDGK